MISSGFFVVERGGLLSTAAYKHYQVYGTVAFYFLQTWADMTLNHSKGGGEETVKLFQRVH